MCVYVYIDLSDQETTQMFKSKQSLQEPSTDWNMWTHVISHGCPHSFCSVQLCKADKYCADSIERVRWIIITRYYHVLLHVCIDQVNLYHCLLAKLGYQWTRVKIHPQLRLHGYLGYAEKNASCLTNIPMYPLSIWQSNGAWQLLMGKSTN